jgi:hypothetical protein
MAVHVYYDIEWDGSRMEYDAATEDKACEKFVEWWSEKLSEDELLIHGKTYYTEVAVIKYRYDDETGDTRDLARETQDIEYEHYAGDVVEHGYSWHR